MLVRISLLIGSIWALRRELGGIGIADLVHRIVSQGWLHVAMALAGTVASFLILGGVEIVALRSVRIPPALVSGRLAIATAFVAHAFGQSIGLSVLTGTAVRLRAYGRRGLDAARVTRVSVTAMIAVTLGLMAAGACALLASRAPLPVGPHTIAVRPLGVLLGAIVLAYLAWSVVGRGPSAPWRWGVSRPTPRIALSQVIVSAADWLVTGAVLYAVLPADSGIGIAAFMRAYVIAQTVGVASHVPAGAGVFEVVLLTLLTAAHPTVDRAALLAAIVMYRAIYYLLPLCVAIVLAGVRELRPSRRRFRTPREAAATVRAPIEERVTDVG